MIPACYRADFKFRGSALSLIMLSKSTMLGKNSGVNFQGSIITFLPLSPFTIITLRYHFCSMISITLSLSTKMVISNDFSILSLALSLLFNDFNILCSEKKRAYDYHLKSSMISITFSIITSHPLQGGGGGGALSLPPPCPPNAVGAEKR